MFRRGLLLLLATAGCGQAVPTSAPQPASVPTPTPVDRVTPPIQQPKMVTKPVDDPYSVNWWEVIPKAQRAPLIAKANEAFAELKKAGVEISQGTADYETPYLVKLTPGQLTQDGTIEPKILSALRTVGVTRLHISSPNLDGVMLSDAGAAQLGQLRCLNSLTLEWVDLTDAGLVGMKDLKALEQLAIWNTQKQLKITGDGFAHLAGLPKLIVLQIRKASITDPALLKLKEIPNLAQLNLQQNPITDAGLSAFAACPHLTKLDLTQSPAITAAELKKLQTLKPNLDIRMRSR